MASQGRATTEDGRRTGMSPRPRGRDNAKDTLCRNMTIYGHCRWENKGCAFNHDPIKAHATTPESTKKRLNVDSPSFTPLSSSPNLSVNGLATKPAGLSPKVANAAPFKPKGLNAGALPKEAADPSAEMTAQGGDAFNKKQYNPAAPDWSLTPSSDLSEFLPQAMAQNIMPKPDECIMKNVALGQTPLVASSPHTPSRRDRVLLSSFLPDDAAANSSSLSPSPAGRSWIPPARPMEHGRVSRSPPLHKGRRPRRSRYPTPPSGPRRVQSVGDSMREARSMETWAPRPTVPHFDPHQRSASYSPVAHLYLQADANAGMGQGLFDPYVGSSTPLGNAGQGMHQTQINPYSNDQSTNGATPFFQGNAFAQLPQYHLYTSQAPHRENLTSQQRQVRDFFISDQLREELQRKSAAQLQVMPNANLPPNIDFFHSIVPLDTNHQRNTALFGYPSWMYKAISGNDGKHYALRRVEGFRLNDDRAMLPIKTAWKRIINANVVTIIDAFTNRSFGDSSLFLVTDYHPLSKTLAETHLAQHHGGGRFPTRQQSQHTPVTEQILWSYIFQISNALRAIHAAGLAARVLDASKILVTSKNRIRLNGCGVLDVVQWGAQAPTPGELQREDFVQFGKLILQLGLNASKGTLNIPQAVEQFGRNYSAAIKERVGWLLGFMNPQRQAENIDAFLQGLVPQMTGAFDAAMHEADHLTTELGRELENGRLVRLMTKLNFITERPDFNHDRGWSENGDRYPIKLFRDWVFHQVDQQGNPRLDLAHVLSCLNKLDAGSEERMTLISRDEQTCIVVSYREIKRAVDGAYQDLAKASRRSGNM